MNNTLNWGSVHGPINGGRIRYAPLPTLINIWLIGNPLIILVYPLIPLILVHTQILVHPLIPSILVQIPKPHKKAGLLGRQLYQ